MSKLAHGDPLALEISELERARDAALRSLVTTAKDRNRVSAELVAMTEERDRLDGELDRLAGEEMDAALNRDKLTDEIRRLKQNLRATRACWVVVALLAVAGWLA